MNNSLRSGSATISSRAGLRRRYLLLLAVLLVPAALVALPSAGQARPKPTLAQVKQRVEALQHRAEQATEQYNATQEQLKSLALLVGAAQQKVVAERSQVEVARRSLGKIVVEMYKQGDLSELSFLLSSDPDTLMQATGAVQSLADRRTDAVGALKVELVALDHAVADLTGQVQRIQSAKASRDALRKAIEADLATTQRELSTLTASQQTQVIRAKAPADRAVRGSTCAQAGIVSPPGRVGKVIDFLCAHLGDPYQWAAAGPDRFDCSGLSQQAWLRAGVSLPHNAAMQASYGKSVSSSQLQVGDLVFFYQPISHMGIYVGNGMMIAAPQTGDVVKIASVRYAKLVAAVRL